MTAITIIERSELERLVERACAAAVERAFAQHAEASGAEWGVSDVAAHLRVSTSTVIRMEARGDLPRRAGGRWRKADVLQWRRDRASEANGPAQAPRNSATR